METKAKWTPGPWVCHSGMVWKVVPNQWPEGTEDGIPIARMDRDTPHTKPTERDANAARIVLCCNAHDALVEVLGAATEVEAVTQGLRLDEPANLALEQLWQTVTNARDALRAAGVEP